MNTISMGSSLTLAVAVVALGPCDAARAEAKIYEVRTGQLFVRAGPSDLARRVARLQEGERVQVYGVSEGWARVHPTQEHWAFRGHLRRTGRPANADTSTVGVTSSYALQGRDSRRGPYRVVIHLTDHAGGKVDVTREATYRDGQVELHSGTTTAKKQGSRLDLRLEGKRGIANALAGKQTREFVDLQLRFLIDGRLELRDRSERGAGAASQQKAKEVPLVSELQAGPKPLTHTSTAEPADGEPSQAPQKRATLELVPEGPPAKTRGLHFVLEESNPDAQPRALEPAQRLLGSWGLEASAGLPLPLPTTPAPGRPAQTRIEVWITSEGLRKALSHDRDAMLDAHARARTVLAGRKPRWSTAAGRKVIEAASGRQFQTSRLELERARELVKRLQALGQARSEAARSQALQRLTSTNLSVIATLVELAPRAHVTVDASLAGRRAQLGDEADLTAVRVPGHDPNEK